MKKINLGLQGGGSHGAFTWGVLDRLLAEPDLEIEGISGTSAGAINAIAVAHGYAMGEQSGVDPKLASRETLRRIWNGVVTLGSFNPKWVNNMDLFGFLPILAKFMGSIVSPYQTNPLDISPLRELIRMEIDFDAVSKLKNPKIFVCACHVDTGQSEIFSGKRLTLDAVMASATLPMMNQAVNIEGKNYWDGGFSGNPSLSPLIDLCDSRDILLVQINPLSRETLPKTADEISDRINEITFNASLIGQLKGIAFINKLLEAGNVGPGAYKTLNIHRIDGGESLAVYGAASKMSVDAAMIKDLFDKGRAAGDEWLLKNR